LLRQNDPTRVFRHGCVVGQESDAFDGGLGDQQAVDRVLVDRRQLVDGDGMGAENGQFVVAVVDQAAPQNARMQPAFAITNGSPRAANSTRRESWVLASWILYVRTGFSDKFSPAGVVHPTVRSLQGFDTGGDAVRRPEAAVHRDRIGTCEAIPSP